MTSVTDAGSVIDRTAMAVTGVPNMTESQGRRLHRLLVDRNATASLELGVAHGVGLAYMAAAMEETGGHATGVDIEESANPAPTAEQILAKAGLSHRATVVREKSSYTWFLKKKIQEQTSGGVCIPCYDFIYIDGPKHWTTDGAAFFMADKLLKPGGTILFDDYSWTHGDYARAGHTATSDIRHSEMAPDELEDAQIRSVFHLLVMQHPSYSNFRIEDGEWAWADKVASDVRTVRIVTEVQLKARLVGLLRVVKRRLFR